MSTIQSKPAAKATITCTIDSLASSATAGRASTVVDNSTNKYIDAQVFVNIDMPGSGTPANDKRVYVYAYGGDDTSAGNYSDGVTGSDAAFTHTDPPNLPLIGIVECPAISTTPKGGPFSVASAFGGVLPPFWGVVIRNYTGVTLDSSGNSVTYVGIEAEAV